MQKIKILLAQLLGQYYCAHSCQISERLVESKGAYSIWNKANLRDLIAVTGLVILLKLDSNCQFFSPCDLEIWWMTPKTYRAHLLYYIKLCVSFHIHQWIQTGVTVRKPPIWVKFNDFFNRVTLKFDRRPWNPIGHLFYASSSFVHHFVAIGEFKLESQSGNTQFGTKSTIFLAMWPWNLTDDLEKEYFVHHFVATVEFKLQLQSGNAQVGPNSTIFRAVWPWNLTDDLEKHQGTSSMLLQALCIIS